MGAETHLLWHETAPREYNRGIDEAEQLYTSLAKTFAGTGHTYFAITAYTGLTISVTASEAVAELETRLHDSFRYAWKRLRYDHPTLAAPVEYDPFTKSCRKIYRSPQNEAEVNEWLEETLKFVNTGENGLEFANSDPVVGRFATLYILTPRQTSGQSSLKRDIVFSSHHDIIDGIGTLILFNNLFRHASEAFNSPDDHSDIVFGDEHQNLSPPFRIASGIPPMPTQAQAEKFNKIQTANIAAAKDAEVLGVPFNANITMPRRSQRIATHLSAAETHTLLSKCKTAGATVTQAFHAAIALAVRDIQKREDQERKAKYISYSLINLRAACKPPYNSTSYAAAVYHSTSANRLVVDLTIPAAKAPKPIAQPAEEFLQVLKQVKAFYQSFKPDADYLATVPSLYARSTPPYPDEPCPVPPPNKTPSVSLSSMGLVDKIIQPKYGRFEVEEPWVIGAEYSTGLGLFLGTWKGVLCLSSGYNEAYHSSDEVMSFLQRVKNVILEGLEVNTLTGE
jgi:hypothetical protein